MINAARTGFWGNHYAITRGDGTPVTTWDIGRWTSGGGFVLDGHEYKVRAGAWGTRYTMLDDGGAVVAEAARAGRKHWTVLAGGREYRFRRPSLLGNEQHLVDGERTIGVVRRTSNWTGALTADLPTLPLAVQIFVLGILITQWNAAAAAAA